MTAYLRNGGDGKSAWLSLKPATTPEAAAVTACRYLARRDVREEIAKANDCLGATSRARLMRELEAIAFTPLSDLMTWNERGERVVKDSRLLTPQEAAAIRSVQIRETSRASENGVTIDRHVEIEQHAKVPALAMLAKLQGFIVERHELTGRDGGPIEHAVRFYLPAPARVREPVVIDATALPEGPRQNGAQQNARADGDNPGYTENGGQPA